MFVVTRGAVKRDFRRVLFDMGKSTALTAADAVRYNVHQPFFAFALSEAKGILVVRFGT